MSREAARLFRTQGGVFVDVADHRQRHTQSFKFTDHQVYLTILQPAFWEEGVYVSAQEVTITGREEVLKFAKDIISSIEELDKDFTEGGEKS